MFNNRSYRTRIDLNNRVAFTVTARETNLHIQARTDLSDAALRSVLNCRSILEAHIRKDPRFSDALTPLPMPLTAPYPIREMIRAGMDTGTGPMAAVAGAVAEFTGRDLMEKSDEVIIENGGDVFIRARRDVTSAVFAGDSPLSMRVGVTVRQRSNAFGLCTSSGTIGHSKSFGRADAATVLAASCILADAAATALANQVKTGDDIPNVLEKGRNIPGIQGIVLIKGDQLGAWGDLHLTGL